MTPLVVDSSALVDHLLGRADAVVVSSIERVGVSLNVPALCDAEVVSALRQTIQRGTITRERARDALKDYGDLPLIRHPHVILLARALELETFSAYDAIYVALAERLEAPLLTTDGRLARALATTRGVKVSLA